MRSKSLISMEKSTYFDYLVTDSGTWQWAAQECRKMLVFLNEVLGVSIDVENVVADKAPYPISILPEGDDWRVLALETETFFDYDIALQLVAAKMTR